MSNLTVNTISPRTTANVDFTGIDVPTYLGQQLAIATEVLPLSGGTVTGDITMIGDITLSGDAVNNLHPVAKQQFNNSLTGNGYQRLPGGLIIQWFTTTIGDTPSGVPGSTGSLTFPVAFSTACFVCLGGIQVTASNHNNLQVAITSKTVSGINYQVQEWGNEVNPCTINFIAIGT